MKSLTTDHKPSDLLEWERIESVGGIIDSFKDDDGNDIGPSWVWAPDDDMPGLAMSRSIGDGLAHLYGVIPDPDIECVSITHEDKFLIIASDGVWEFLTNQQVAEIVAPYFNKGLPE